MYEGHLDKDNGGGGGERIECERWGLGRAGASNGGKMGTTVIEQQ